MINFHQQLNTVMRSDSDFMRETLNIISVLQLKEKKKKTCLKFGEQHHAHTPTCLHT